MSKIIYVFILILLGAVSIFAQENTSVSYFAVTWSPDGKYLSFTEMRRTNTTPPTMKADIFIMKTDGTEAKKITGDESNEFAPVWSKDGKRIFFGATTQGSKEGNIFSVNWDGSGLT